MILVDMNGEEGGTQLRERDFRRMRARLIETGHGVAACGPDPDETGRPGDRRPHSALPNGAWTLPTNRNLHL
jgi:hypothetical protein